MLKCTAFAWLNPSLGSSTYTQRTSSGFLRLMLFPAMHNDCCRPHALLKLQASAGTAVVAAAVHTKFNGLLWNRDALPLSLSLPLKKSSFFVPLLLLLCLPYIVPERKSSIGPHKLLTQQTLPSASAGNRKRSAPSQTIPFQRGHRSVYDQPHYHKLIHKLAGGGGWLRGSGGGMGGGLCEIAPVAACCPDTVRGAERPSDAACLLSGCGQGR